MNWMFWVITGFFVIFFITRMLPAKGVNTITTAELKAVLKDRDKQFIDVRSPGEYAGRRIKDFTNIPLQQIQAQLNKLDREKEIVLICQSGMRSSQAAKILKKAGFEKVTNVRGGMSAY